MKKIVNNKYYLVIMTVVQIAMLAKIAIMFLFKNSTFDGESGDFWLDRGIEFIALLGLFVFDLVASASVGNLRYVKEKCEEGFQMKRYASISAIVSGVFSFAMWIFRFIHYANNFDNIIAMLLLLVILIFGTMFILFWIMMLVFFISNNIANKKNEKNKANE